ncbi:MAG: 5'-nucleotidase C-terminal domain-containing protein [Bdellovibrionota bacterium]
MFNKRYLSLYLFLILFSNFSYAYTPGKTYKVTILHTNDHHGAFWKNKDNEYGMAARATLIKKLRSEVAAEGGHVILLDGGDVNTGTPESEISDAEADFRGMSLMGYDAMAIGNHEFDKPLNILLKQQKEWATFPFLSANIYNKKTKTRFFEATKTIKLDDLNVALLGLTTEQTPQQSIRFPHDELEIRSPIVEASKLVPKIRKNSDVLIAVTHMGHYPNAQHGSRAPGDVSLARKVKGIDLIVGGHTQLPLFTADYENGTYIVQAGEWGKHLGRVDLEFKDGKVTLANYELIPVNLKNQKMNPQFYSEDKNALALLKPFKDKSLKLTSQVVGKLNGKLEGHRSIIRKTETNLGNFVTFLMAQSTGAGIAITDSGVIRNSLEEGTITFGDILSVHPLSFGLRYATVNLSGKELWDYLSQVAPLTDGSYPQFYGIKVILLNNVLNKVEIKDPQKQTFAPLSLNKNYKLALTDFIAAGGDSYPRIDKHPTYKLSSHIDSEVMKEYFEKNKVVQASAFAPIGNLVKLNEAVNPSLAR